jgi:hypothetical protein
MTSAELTIVIPLYSGAAVLIIDRVFDAYRRVRKDEADRQKEAAEQLFRASVAKRGEHVDDKLHEIKQQTNGNTKELLTEITALRIENGRLHGMVAGMQVASGRAPDVVVTTGPSAPAAPKAETAQGTP